jgi:uncharacterized protein YegP (UPF0339 family)
MEQYKNGSFTLEVYKTRILRQWRWRLKAGNNKVIIASTESYKNRIDCMYNISIVNMGLNNIVEHIISKND